MSDMRLAFGGDTSRRRNRLREAATLSPNPRSALNRQRHLSITMEKLMKKPLMSKDLHRFEQL